MKVAIETPFITLQGLIKLSPISSTGGFSKVLIQGGFVFVNGERELRRKRKIYPGDRVLIESDLYEINEEIEVIKEK